MFRRSNTFHPRTKSKAIMKCQNYFDLGCVNGEPKSKKAHIQALVCAPKLICAFKCAPKFVCALKCELVCAPKLSWILCVSWISFTLKVFPCVVALTKHPPFCVICTLRLSASLI